VTFEQQIRHLTRMLLTEDGEMIEAISGGGLERDIQRHAVRVMQADQREHLVYDSTGDDEDAEEDRLCLGRAGTARDAARPHGSGVWLVA
jgi:xanthine/CO dehydrogenase XdhC/CoxF family maturation factor